MNKTFKVILLVLVLTIVGEILGTKSVLIGGLTYVLLTK